MISLVFRRVCAAGNVEVAAERKSVARDDVCQNGRKLCNQMEKLTPRQVFFYKNTEIQLKYSNVPKI